MAEEKQQRVVEVLPALNIAEGVGSITVDDNDRRVTEVDLEHINTLLSCCEQALPCVRTIAGLTRLSEASLKLIEGRRNVMKLPFGASKTIQRNGRTIETLE